MKRKDGRTQRTTPAGDRWTGLARVVRPTLIVAVGGTGAAAAKVARRRIGELLGDEGPRNHFLAFRAFDTAYQDHREPRFVDNAEYVYLGGFNAQAVIADIVEGNAYPHWATWLPPRLNFQQVAFGAGGIRPIGRLCYFYRREQVEAAIHEALTTITDADRALRFHQETGIRVNLEAGIDIHVICSVCGGTGSGMFLDLSFDLRRWAEEHTDREVTLTGHLVLPEAFRTKPVVLKALEANAYVALEELDRFMNATNADPWTVEHIDGRPESTWRAPFDHCYLLSGLQDGGTSDVDTLTSMIGEAVTLLTLSQVGQKVSEGVINMAGQRKSTRDGRGRLCCYSSYGVLGLEIPWGLLAETLAPGLATAVRERLVGSAVGEEDLAKEVERFRNVLSLDPDQLTRLLPEPQLELGGIQNLLEQYKEKSELPRARLVDLAQRSHRELEETVQKVSAREVWSADAIRAHLAASLDDWLQQREGGLADYLDYLRRSTAELRILAARLREQSAAARRRADELKPNAEPLEEGKLSGMPWPEIWTTVDHWKERLQKQAEGRILQDQAAKLDAIAAEIERRLIAPWRLIQDGFRTFRPRVPRDARSYYQSRQALTAVCPIDYFQQRIEGDRRRLVNAVLGPLLKDVETWSTQTPEQLADRFSELCTKAVSEHFANQSGIDCDELLADCYGYPSARYSEEVMTLLIRAGANWELHESYSLRGNRLEISAIGAEVGSRLYQNLFDSNHHITPVEEQRPEYVPIFRTEHGLSLIGIKRLDAYRASLLDSIVHEQRYDLHFFLDRRWITRMEFVGDDLEERRLLELFSQAEMEGLIHRKPGHGYLLTGDSVLIGEYRRKAFLRLREDPALQETLQAEIRSRRGETNGWEDRILKHVAALRDRIEKAVYPGGSGNNGAIQPRFLSLDVFQIHSEIRALLAGLHVEEKGI